MNASFLLSTANPFYELTYSPYNASYSHSHSRKRLKSRGKQGDHVSKQVCPFVADLTYNEALRRRMPYNQSMSGA